MPYTNINWIKLKLDLLSEHRFIEECDDIDKLLFIGLLMLAGITRNKIPNNPKYIKRMLNLQVEEPKIAEKLVKICSLFRGVKGTPDYIRFSNFNKLHNYLRNAEGMPKDSTRIEKNRIDKIRIEYVRIKGFSIKDFTSDDYGRTAKAIKTLLFKANHNDELVIQSLGWAAKQTWCDWTLETVIKKWHDFLRVIFKKAPEDILKKHIEEWKKEERFSGSA